MFETLTNRWRPRLQTAAPWARWTTAALGSAAVLAVSPSALWIRCSMAPALAIGLVQLGRLTRAAIRQPRLDSEADDRLQVLVDRTCLPDTHLIEVVANDQVSGAGQLARTVDLATGQSWAMWFSQACFPVGSLVLFDVTSHSIRALDWMPPSELQAAYRHRTRGIQQRDRAAAALHRELARELADASRRSRARRPTAPQIPRSC